MILVPLPIDTRVLTKLGNALEAAFGEVWLMRGPPGSGLPLQLTMRIPPD